MRTRLLLVCVGVAVAMTAAVVLPKIEPIRSWRITQTKPLVDSISMRVEDVYLFAAGTNKLLRVQCRYLGGDPNERFFLRASIRTTPESSEIDPEYVWQVGLPDDDHGGIPKIWEFRTPPNGASQLILRIYYKNKTEGTKEQFVDYRIPYLPKVTSL